MSADRTKGSEIGARVAALRARAGLTQGDVAERLGMSQRLLSYYEREASDIPASMLVPLADVLGVEVWWLLDVMPAAISDLGEADGAVLNREMVNWRSNRG